MILVISSYQGAKLPYNTSCVRKTKDATAHGTSKIMLKAVGEPALHRSPSQQSTLHSLSSSCFLANLQTGMFSKSLHSFFVPHLFTKLSRLSQYFKWNLTQRLAFAEQFLGSSSHSLQEDELEQLLHLKLVTKRNENMINTSEEKNRAFTDQGWNHFKHTRVAVALARGIFFCFLAKKTKQKKKKR